MDPDLVRALKAFPDVTRLRLLGRLAAGPATLDELATLTGLRIADVARHVQRLQDADLVLSMPRRPGEPVTVHLVPARLAELGRALDAADAEATARPVVGDPLLGDLSAEDASVVRGYLVDGRLVALPSTDRKRLPVLRWLRDRIFTEDRGYPEAEVNQAIALVHEDVASLRRYLVDSGLATRERGIYRRAGDRD